MPQLDTAKIGATLKKIPWWGYAGGGGVVLALAYYIRKGTSSPSTANAKTASVGSTATPDASGLQMADLAGLPYDSMDPGYNSDPYYSREGITSGYNPDTTPPSGSPPPDNQPMGGPMPPENWFPPYHPPVGNPIDPNPPRPGPNPTPMPPTPAPPTEGSTDFTHAFHAWPAWDSTLGGVANREGMTWQGLYSFDGNKAIIDAEAHAHGFFSNEYNHVWPTETIHVPHPLPAS